VKLVAAVGLLLVGAVTGLTTVAVHELVWGFVLALTATAVTAFALPPGWWSRLAFVLGWIVMVGWLTLPRPEGDYLISQDWQGYGVLGFGMLLLVAGLATLPRPGGRSPSAPPAAP
jgi:hypothetical protein